MDQRTTEMFFALVRSAIRGTELTQEERKNYSENQFSALIKIAKRHDIAHLLALGLQRNALLTSNDTTTEKHILEAAYRYEQLRYEYERLCLALESAQIPFVPLKGSVLRGCYPEAWMRTSCDIDILVHREDLETAVAYLVKHLHYTEKGRELHDVSLFTPTGIHIELHFDLVEEGRANNAINILQTVWEHVSLRKNSAFFYEMTDAFFYFYHIAHMAKHFENGGCGVRPFIDLWILDNMVNTQHQKRDNLLRQGGLLQFANVSRKLSNVWFGGETADELSLQMQEFIVHGGMYGSSDNRVALQQKNKGGRVGYLLSRIWIPYTKLRRYYPVVEKHHLLIPFMQVRRWFMLLKPNVASMAKREIATNNRIEQSKAAKMQQFLENVGL